MTTTTEPTTGERIVVIPEVTIPASARTAVDTVNRLIDKLMPELEELHAAATELRDAYDHALVVLYPFVGGGYDEVHELASGATGWDAAWNRLYKIGDMFDDHSLYGGGLSLAEIARGGEPNIPSGTFARVNDPDGKPVRVMVQRVPVAEDERYHVVNADDLSTYYSCDHAELAAGIEEVEY